jgi:hypothetical protein
LLVRQPCGAALDEDGAGVADGAVDGDGAGGSDGTGPVGGIVGAVVVGGVVGGAVVVCAKAIGAASTQAAAATIRKRFMKSLQRLPAPDP